MKSGKTKILKILLPALAVATLIILIILDAREPEVQSQTYFDAFDTISTLYDYSGDKDFSTVGDTVGRMMQDYHELYDIYHAVPDKSNLYTVNNAGGEWVAVDEKIIELLEWGIDIYALTEGEVNIAMGSVTTLWKSALKSGRLPTEAELATAALHTDITKIEIDRSTSAVRLADPEMTLDVGAVAKGFTEEKIAEWLISEGKRGYAIDMGGNLRAIGTKPSGEGFTTGIRNPNVDEGGFVETFTLSDEASATSGGYERFYEIGGIKYHHIIDKDTLAPQDKYLSVSIVTKSAALADALSTAVFCMTEDEISELLTRLDGGIRIIIIDKDEKILHFDK